MANQKTTELTANTAPVDADLVAIVDDVAGTPTNKKVTLANFAAGAPFTARYQPLDSDLTAIAALTTTAFGRALLTLADAAAGRTALGLGTAAVAATGDFDPAGSAASAQAASQPVDSDLTAIAALTTTAFGRSVLEAANAAALRTLAGTIIGTDVQAYDADLAAIAALTSAADKLPYATGAGTWALTDFTAAGRAIVDDADASAQRTTLGLGTAAVVNTGTASGNVPLNSDLRTFAAGTRTTPDTGTPGEISVDVSLAGGIAGGDTLNGGSAASEELTLGSTSHNTRGLINLRDEVRLISEDKTYSTQSDVVSLFQTYSARTITLSSSTSTVNGVAALRFAPTVVFAAAAGGSPSYLFNNEAIWKNDNANARTVLAFVSFRSAPTYRGDGATLTITSAQGANSSPTFDRINAGAVTCNTFSGFVSTATVGADCTLTGLTHYEVIDVSNSGTVTTQSGLYIPPLSGATTSIGINNASRTVFPPATNNITSASSTITEVRTAARLVNNTGSSITLTSAPTIADGVTGQIVVVFNSSSNDVVLQDQGTLASSNLRLGAATRTIGTRDSIMLMFNSQIGDWIELAYTNVI